MTDAPDKIWAWTWTGEQNRGQWSFARSSYATEYTRTDIHKAAVEKERTRAEAAEAEVERLRGAMEEIRAYVSNAPTCRSRPEG